MLYPSSTSAMIDAIRNARAVTLSAYVLKNSAVIDALEEAAAQGTAVLVRLDGFAGKDPSNLRANLDIVRHLRDLKADAQVVDRHKSDRPQLHLKAAVCDNVAYLDDCNWRTGDDTVVRDTTPQDVAAVKRAASYEPASGTPGLAIDKRDALQREHDLLASARAGDRIDVETESIGYGSPVYSALERLAGRGVHCRLLADFKLSTQRQRKALQHLADAGVDVRTCPFTEKFAVVNSRTAWIGSANGTSWRLNPDNIDWGAVTHGAALPQTLQRHFSAHWRVGRPLER